MHPADTIASRLAADPWHTPRSLVCGAVELAEAETERLDVLPRDEQGPRAAAALDRARRYLAEFAPMATSDDDCELLGWLIALCDELEKRQAPAPLPCIPPPPPARDTDVRPTWAVDLLAEWSDAEGVSPVASTEPAPAPPTEVA